MLSIISRSLYKDRHMTRVRSTKDLPRAVSGAPDKSALDNRNIIIDGRVPIILFFCGMLLGAVIGGILYTIFDVMQYYRPS